MNNVDLFIKYLAGELDRKEAADLQRRLEADHQLRQEFQATSDAWDLVRTQLRKKDENDFKMRLLEVMERSVPEPVKRSPFRSKWGIVALPLAGVLVLLLVLFVWFRDQDRLVARYYHPGEDPVVLALSDISRGGAKPGILLYNQGRYGECMEEMGQLLQKDPSYRQALLYYLLASIENGNEAEGLRMYDIYQGDQNEQVDQAINWYAALAMIKTGRKKEASALLAPLAERSGPYRRDARQLLKRVSK
ncbi:MAG: tetratricopeptide repeat protein [Bacteroidales bacterium]